MARVVCNCVLASLIEELHDCSMYLVIKSSASAVAGVLSAWSLIKSTPMNKPQPL